MGQQQQQQLQPDLSSSPAVDGELPDKPVGFKFNAEAAVFHPEEQRAPVNENDQVAANIVEGASLEVPGVPVEEISEAGHIQAFVQALPAEKFAEYKEAFEDGHEAFAALSFDMQVVLAEALDARELRGG